jgi:hypothetical protein
MAAQKTMNTKKSARGKTAIAITTATSTFVLVGIPAEAAGSRGGVGSVGPGVDISHRDYALSRTTGPTAEHTVPRRYALEASSPVERGKVDRRRDL